MNELPPTPDTIDQTKPIEKPKERRDIDPDVEKYLQEKIDQLTQEIEVLKSELYKNELTGLPNQKYLNDHIQNEFDNIEDPTKKTGSLGIVFIDMNGLKQINDNPELGHQVADEILKQVAQIINNGIRKFDIAIHRSGDEFLVLLSVENPTKIQQAFHSFQKRTEASLSKPLSVGDKKIPVSLSMGFDSIKKGEKKNWKEMAALAEERMYKAKSAFKNSQNHPESESI